VFNVRLSIGTSPARRIVAGHGNGKSVAWIRRDRPGWQSLETDEKSGCPGANERLAGGRPCCLDH